MELAIQSIAGHGDQHQERIALRASAACRLGDFMLADSTYVDDHRVSNRLRHVHWFGDQQLRAGDWVVLYTRRGENSTTKQADGSIVYFRYWNLDRPVWNDAGDEAQLFKIAERASRRAK